MAVTYVGTASAVDSSSSSSLSVSHTVPSGSDRCLVLGGGSFNAAPTSATFNGNALTSHQQLNSSGDRAYQYYRVAPTVTTANAVVNFAAAEEVTFGVLNFAGVDQTTPLDTAVTQTTTTGTAKTVTVTSGATDDMVVDVITSYDSGDMTQGAGQTRRWHDRNNASHTSSAGSTEAGGASVTMSWTLDSSGGAHLIASNINQAVAAQTIEPDGLAESNAIGSPTLSAGAVTVSVNGLAESNAIGTVGLSSEYTIDDINGLAGSPQIGSAVLAAGPVVVSVNGLAATHRFGTVGISGGVPVATGPPDQSDFY